MIVKSREMLTSTITNFFFVILGFILILFQVLSGEKEIDFENVQRVLEEKSKLVIDVRNPNEFAKGKIPGAHNLPCKFIFNLSIWEHNE